MGAGGGISDFNFQISKYFLDCQLFVQDPGLIDLIRMANFSVTETYNILIDGGNERGMVLFGSQFLISDLTSSLRFQTSTWCPHRTTV